MLTLHQREMLLQRLTPTVRTSQIIVGALVGGLVMFLLFAVFVGSGGEDQADEQNDSMFSYLMIGLAASSVVPWVVVPRGMQQSQVQRLARSVPEGAEEEVLLADAKALAAIYQTVLIVKCALLEGAAFANLTAYYVEANVLSLIVGGVLVLGVALHFPTANRVLSWIEARILELQARRGLPDGRRKDEG